MRSLMKMARWPITLSAFALVLAVSQRAFGAGTTDPPPPPPAGPPPPPPPPPEWIPYGFAMPGDPIYGFGLPSNDTKTFFAMAAKGNVVIGDYTSPEFRKNVTPLLTPGTKDAKGNLIATTQPYAIDPTDEPLGYQTGSGGVMFDVKNRPLFDGNYNQIPVGGTRKFYESDMADTDFKKLINPLDPLYAGRGGCCYDGAYLDGVFFTNHAVAGYTGKSLEINGAMISRDDALVVNGSIGINHDLRMLRDRSQGIVLPLSIRRLKLVEWQECPSTGCL